MGRKPCVRMLLGGAEFPGLGAAFMFPADAQPEGEVPHTHGGSPVIPFLPPRRRAPPEVPPPGTGSIRKRPRAKKRGAFSQTNAKLS